jgi:hypothetical protein
LIRVESCGREKPLRGECNSEGVTFYHLTIAYNKKFTLKKIYVLPVFIHKIAKIDRFGNLLLSACCDGKLWLMRLTQFVHIDLDGLAAEYLSLFSKVR